MAQISALLVAILIITSIVAVLLLIAALFGLNTTTTSDDTTSDSCTVPPSMPQGVILTNPSTDLISVSWNTVEDAASYRIYLDTNESFLIRDAQEVKTTTQTSISFGDLLTGAKYYVKVTAFSACGESIPSSEMMIDIPFIWPARFQIVNSDNPDIDIAAGIFFLIVSDINCTPASCWWYFDEVDSTIHREAFPSVCLMDFGAGTPGGVFCTSGTLDNRQWKYNSITKNLCILNDDTSCIQLAPGFTYPGDLGDSLVMGLPTGDFRSEWDIIEV